ncbi:hypothetical protein D3C73_1288480 [compost metagenome]
MAGGQHLNSPTIGDDHAVKSPCAAENVLQQRGIHRAGYAVDFVIGGHHGYRARFNCLLKRQQVYLEQFTPAHMHRPGIAAALRAAVAGEVLQRSADAPLAAQRLTLQPFDGSRRQLADQIGVLAEAFLGAPPAGIAHHIQHRRIRHRSALAPRLQRDCPAHLPV